MLNRNKLISLVKSLAKLGLIYRVKFGKKDGSIRTMTCRGGVYKYVNGQGRPGGPSQTDNPYVTVYEMTGKSGKNYRTINLDTITDITTCGITATVTPEPLVPIDCSSYNTDNIVKLSA